MSLLESIRESQRYRRTQVGYLIVAGMVLCVLFVSYHTLKYGVTLGGVGLLLSAGLCFVMFSTLTVTVEANFFEVSFGIGFLRKRVFLDEAKDCRVVKNPIIYGWGIRRIPNGWLYNVSGLKAVEVAMKNGKIYRIGTDAPEELCGVLKKAIKGDGDIDG